MLTAKRWIIVISIVLIASAVLILFLSNESDPAETADRKQAEDDNFSGRIDHSANHYYKRLFVSVSMREEEYRILEQLSMQFEQTHPDIDVILYNIHGMDAYERFKREAQIGNSADIILLDNAWVNEFAALGYLSPRLDELFTGDRIAPLIDLMMGQVRWNGYIWGVPKDVDPYVLVWNKEQMNQLGMEGPPHTAEELMSLHRMLLQSNDQRIGIYADPEDPYGWITLFRAFGGVWSDPLTGKLDVDPIQTSDMLDALLAPVELDEQEFTPLFPAPSNAWDPWEQIKSGAMAMMVARASDYRTHMDEQLTMSALPRESRGSEGAWLLGRSFCISARSGYSREALELITLMTSKEVQNEWMESGGAFPVIVSAYASTTWKTESRMQDIALAIEKGTVPAAEPYLPIKLELLEKELAGLLDGTMSGAEFVESLQSQWSESVR